MQQAPELSSLQAGGLSQGLQMQALLRLALLCLQELLGLQKAQRQEAVQRQVLGQLGPAAHCPPLAWSA